MAGVWATAAAGARARAGRRQEIRITARRFPLLRSWRGARAMRGAALKSSWGWAPWAVMPPRLDKV